MKIAPNEACMIHSPLESLSLKLDLNGKSSTWCCKGCYDEMNGIENLWLQHQAEFLLIKLLQIKCHSCVQVCVLPVGPTFPICNLYFHLRAFP